MSKHSGMQQHILISQKKISEETLVFLGFYREFSSESTYFIVPSLSVASLELGGKSVLIAWWLLLQHTAEDENREGPSQCEYRKEEGR